MSLKQISVFVLYGILEKVILVGAMQDCTALCKNIFNILQAELDEIAVVETEVTVANAHYLEAVFGDGGFNYCAYYGI